MKTYIVTCKTSNGDLTERHIGARNHLAAQKAAEKEGFVVVSVVRDNDDGDSDSYRHRKQLKRLIKSLIICSIIAGAFVAFFWWRYRRG